MIGSSVYISLRGGAVESRIKRVGILTNKNLTVN